MSKTKITEDPMPDWERELLLRIRDAVHPDTNTTGIAPDAFSAMSIEKLLGVAVAIAAAKHGVSRRNVSPEKMGDLFASARQSLIDHLNDYVRKFSANAN